MLNPIRVAIADSNELYRLGLVASLSNFKKVQLILSEETGTDLINNIHNQRPHIIIMDLKALGSLNVVEFIKHRYDEIKIIVLTNLSDEEYVLKLLKLGVNGFLRKNAGSAEIEEAIVKVSIKGNYYNDYVTGIMQRRLITLTERECSIVKLICQEYTNVEIAEKLSLSPRTLEGYRQRLMRKVGAKNTAGLVYKMFSEKLICSNWDTSSIAGRSYLASK